MAPRRFIINSGAIRDGVAFCEGELYNHMARVLRLGSGTPVQLADEKGFVHSGTIALVERDCLTVNIESSLVPEDSEAVVPRITICQALPKGEKTELILQKGTELGAFDFWLFGGRRSVARLRDDQQKSKLERWNRVASEAARQSGRSSVPGVVWHSDAAGAAREAGHELRLLLWEGERHQSLKGVLSGCDKPVSLIVAIGPEGGFDPVEVELFVGQGFLPVSLGSRILRTETASIAILAIMQYMWGDM